MKNERETFLRRLRLELRGLPRATVDDILADYDGHFEAGLAAGRSEAEVVQRLGDPRRLGRELRAEAVMKRWEDERSFAAGLGVVVGVIGLAALDLFIVLPLLLALGSVLFAVVMTGLVMFAFGCACLPIGLLGMLPFLHLGAIRLILIALGFSGAGIGVIAACMLFCVGVLNLLTRYARAHYRLIAPQAQM